MVNCSIRKCFNRRVKGGDVSFYTFPKDLKMIDAWLKFCKPKTTPSGRVCSVHFTESDKSTSMRQLLMNEKPKGGVRRLKEDAVPSKFLGDEILKVTEVSYQPEDNDGTAQQNRVEISYSIENIKQEQNMNESSSSLTNETGILTNILSKGRIKKRKMPSGVQAYFVPSSSTQVAGQSSSNVKEYYVPLPNRTEQIQSKIFNSADTVIITASLLKSLMLTERKYKLTMKRLRQIFTPGQIRALFSINKEAKDSKLQFGRVKWSAEDIEAAMAFRKISPKAYEYMRDVRGFPLPRHSTIRRWTPKFGIKQDNLEGEATKSKTAPKKGVPKKRVTTLKAKSKKQTPKKRSVNPKTEISEEDISENVVIELNPSTEIYEEVDSAQVINAVNSITKMYVDDISENVVIELNPSTVIKEGVDSANDINASNPITKMSEEDIAENVVIEMDPSTVIQEEVNSANDINASNPVTKMSEEEGISENVVTVSNPSTEIFEEVNSANVVYVVNPITETSKERDTEKVVTELNPKTEISEEAASNNGVKVLENKSETEITKKGAITPEIRVLKVNPTKDMPQGVYKNVVKVLKVNPKTENPKGVVKNTVRVFKFNPMTKTSETGLLKHVILNPKTKTSERSLLKNVIILNSKTNTSGRSLLRSDILDPKAKLSENSTLKNVTMLTFQPKKEITMEGVLRDAIMMPPPMRPLKSKPIGQIRKVKIKD